MPLSGDYGPSPATIVREQVELFERTGGVEGNTVGGAPIVVVTSVGAVSGALRKNPVMRVEHAGSYAVVASAGGRPQHPKWYANLLANPTAELQDGHEVRTFTAREVSGAERDEWWSRAVAAWPAYADYQDQTDRRIPVLVLDPVRP